MNSGRRSTIHSPSHTRLHKHTHTHTHAQAQTCHNFDFKTLSYFKTNSQYLTTPAKHTIKAAENISLALN